MRLIDADDFSNRMYHEAFEKDSDLQKWDSGCWIRYKLFENVLREQPTVQPECKRGEWINEGRIIRCNKCKIGYAVVKGMKSAITYNFCPSCGTDMRGGDSR